ncbi:MAG: bifunctional pyr operon transcriptional regulator/uracil phosphoribosyltransferase PyrR [Oceanospirillaceae bacterium]|nr:bifunctional pyr operon transcriptional regulator/uracil phosphoribosyltransferase PyrR [Oceanospirillaceae bacterium]MCP5350512.1 bifunctional pyr operon transcriptional regulator/uracil phosphoribosyltransferase PyrR [Oceanospirillaceae bacterium]
MSLPSVSQLITDLTQQINQYLLTNQIKNPLVVGIHTGGAWIASAVHDGVNTEQPLASLDICFYRDDFTQNGLHPVIEATDLPVGIDDLTVILVDDVIMSGRTVRAAMNELFDYGRPARVLLATLLDVGGRELPIQPDFCAHKLTLAPNQQIKLQGPEPLTLNFVDLP